MAQFRGTVQGGRGEAARLGHKSTGLRTECQGWNIGVSATARHGEGDEGREHDYITVAVNEGNGYNAGRRVYVGLAMETDHGPVFVPSTDVELAILRAHGVEPIGPLGNVRVNG